MPLSPMAHIRCHVFRVTQGAFAEIAGTTQATVSRWESDNATLEPTLGQLVRIRNEAIRRGLTWNDAWFFQAPSAAQEATSSQKRPSKMTAGAR